MADQTPQPATPDTAPLPPEQAAPPAASGAVEHDEKFFAALGYFAFLFVVPLIVKPKSEYCKFHAKQSMVLFLITIVTFMILFMIPWFGSILTLVIFAVYILAIYKSYSGELWAIPVISKFAGKMSVEALYGKAGLAVGALSGLKDSAQGLAQKAGQTVQNLGSQEQAPQAQQPEAVATPAPAVPTQPAPPPPQAPEAPVAPQPPVPPPAQ